MLHVYSSTPIAGHSLSRLRYKRDSGHKPSNRYCPDDIGTVGQSVAQCTCNVYKYYGRGIWPAVSIKNKYSSVQLIVDSLDGGIQYRRSGFNCEYLLNANCEDFKTSQLIDLQK